MITTSPLDETPPGWRAVESRLTDEIRQGRLLPGERLPPEPALMARFALGRHSVRRAVAALEARGLVATRHGSGTYVRPAPVLDYRLSERTRFSRNLLDQGREPSGALIRAEERPAPPAAAAALGLVPGAPAYNVVRLSLADGVPVNLSDAWYPAGRFPGMLPDWLSGRGASAVLAAHGVPDYLRLWSAVLARLPTEEEAVRLDQPAAQPVLVVRKVDADPDRRPVAFSETVWAGERVQFLIDNADPPPGHEENADVAR